MDILRPFRKCFVCGLKNSVFDRVLKRVEKYSYPDTRYYYYHTDCLRDVRNTPEKYGHRAVDIALDIFDCIEAEVQKANSEVAEYRAKILRLHGSIMETSVLLQITEGLDNIKTDARSVSRIIRQRNERVLTVPVEPPPAEESQKRCQKIKEDLIEKKKESVSEPEQGPSRYDLIKRNKNDQV